MIDCRFRVHHMDRTRFVIGWIMLIQLQKFWMLASYVFSCSEADLLFRASHWRGCEVAVRLDLSIVPLFKNMDDVTESVDARSLLSRFEADLLFFRASHQPICREEWLRKQS